MFPRRGVQQPLAPLRRSFCKRETDTAKTVPDIHARWTWHKAAARCRFLPSCTPATNAATSDKKNNNNPTAEKRRKEERKGKTKRAPNRQRVLCDGAAISLVSPFPLRDPCGRWTMGGSDRHLRDYTGIGSRVRASGNVRQLWLVRCGYVCTECMCIKRHGGPLGSLTMDGPHHWQNAIQGSYVQRAFACSEARWIDEGGGRSNRVRSPWDMTVPWKQRW